VGLAETVRRLDQTVARLESHFAGKTFVLRSERDDLCLRLLFLMFEHHRGILILVESCRPPAFSLMRPTTEAFCRLHVAMHGTESQFNALINDTYRTEIESVGDVIDKVNEFESIFGALYKDAGIKNSLHGFTHLGKQQLTRMSNGHDLGPNYPDEEMIDLVRYVTLITLVAGVSASRFLKWREAHDGSQALLDEYLSMK
jgi:hypothetical protein